MSNEELKQYYDFFNSLQKLLKPDSGMISVPIGFFSGFHFKTDMAASIFAAVMREAGAVLPEAMEGIRAYIRECWAWFKAHNLPSTDEEWDDAITTADTLSRKSPFVSGEWRTYKSEKNYRNGGMSIVMSMMDEIEAIYKARKEDVQVRP